VIASYLLFVAFMATMYAGYTADPRWPAGLAVAAVLLFAATAATFIRVVTSPGYAADTVDRALDEQQQQVRNRAYRSAYIGPTLLFGALTLVVMYAAGEDASWSNFRTLAVFMPWLTFIPGSLPSAVVAWTEADALEDG
jgi:hypothetical protein